MPNTSASRRSSAAAPVPETTPSPLGKGLQHRTMAAAAAAALRERILSGALPGGTQLRQDALADELGVSRIPIREALVQLEAEGLVRIVPHRGAVVSELSAEEVEELFELRAQLEPALLRRSAPRLTAGDHAALDAILAEYRAELRAAHVGRWGELNTRLHALLYSRADRPRTLALVRKLLQDCDRLTRVQLSIAGGLERAEREHGELVALCRAGRIDEGCELLRAHVEHAGAALREILERR
ncbi:MAG TPA: GntR family transcriptional regulator [Salinarimonas sp.]|nr:GntR family transcriptional regulator [Salinarimonas sp.]